MTPRLGLYTTVVGLVLGVVCATALFVFGDSERVSDDANMGIVCLALGAGFGVTVMVVGAIVTGVALFAKHGPTGTQPPKDTFLET